ncbi:alpha-hydroxy acid oxidase [Aquabacterium sp. A08]|uniref:alpha-hydroxy acid oxidase n=1 Tax=Aquabacterium sp. A08 TaxID=2718532 RepID=UPI00141FB74F|nr:alpha-hydroxy acid oxidase [Aquabacterium sp. A08]NIC42404.1 alpha-hydroxy-acid oxidizing protein [Aquabacterium sp. A08]
MGATPPAPATAPVNLADHEALARQRVPDAVWAYWAGGAADEHTLRANGAAWSSWSLRPRVLRPLQGLDTATQVLGQPCPTPLLVAPMARQVLAHPDAERATALAASALGVGLVLSMQSHTALEDVAPLVGPGTGAGPLWFQLYHLGDRGHTLALAQRAHAAGYQALVLTVDAPLQGVRDRERRAGLPGADTAPLPHWPTPHPPGDPAQLLQQAPTWDDVRWLRAHAPLPLLLKGVTHPDDARLALSLGVAGLIVSNHGGRVLDTVLPTAELLPAMADAVQGGCALLVDGGIRRGTDVFKALALGADAVLVGRPVLWGLANGGARGVAHVLRLLRDEFWATMALCGVTRVADIGPEYLHHIKNTNRSRLE